MYAVVKGFSGQELDARIHYCFITESGKPIQTLCRRQSQTNLRRTNIQVDCKLCLKKWEGSNYEER